MIIDHVTVHIPDRALHSGELSAILQRLGFREVPPDHKIEKDWTVRWFKPNAYPAAALLHLVADDNWGTNKPEPGLSHFCVTGVGHVVFEECQHSAYCEHYTEGSERVWLNYQGMRIEVRA